LHNKYNNTYYILFTHLKDTIIFIMLYNFELENTSDLMRGLATKLKQRRLERGLSRSALTQMSGVPEPTIAKFEQKHKISLESFIAILMSLGYTDEIKSLMQEPIYTTMRELDIINKNKQRKRGRNVIENK
jgi:hypothetical protein